MIGVELGSDDAGEAFGVEGGGDGVDEVFCEGDETGGLGLGVGSEGWGETGGGMGKRVWSAGDASSRGEPVCFEWRGRGRGGRR
jgi:hypothetical protein